MRKDGGRPGRGGSQGRKCTSPRKQYGQSALTQDAYLLNMLLLADWLCRWCVEVGCLVQGRLSMAKKGVEATAVRQALQARAKRSGAGARGAGDLSKGVWEGLVSLVK